MSLQLQRLRLHHYAWTSHEPEHRRTHQDKAGPEKMNKCCRVPWDCCQAAKSLM